MTRPRLLDLFCGAGGTAMGYHLAGFDVVGCDIAPQPNYPFPFHQYDALAAIVEHGHRFDFIHASPPCQRYTKGAKQAGTSHNHPNLIAKTRAAILGTGKPYVIENVMESRGDLVSPVMLCGTMFGLGVFRHRLPETRGFILATPVHRTHSGFIGDGRYVTVTGKPGGSSYRDGITHGNKAAWQRAMGITWMTAREMAQAIPPAYTSHIGTQWLAVAWPDQPVTELEETA